MNLLISDRCELESAPIVESVQWKLIQCLQYLVEHFHPEEPRKFSQCLQLLTDLRDVSEQHQQRTIKGQYDDYTMDIIKDHPLIYEALEDSMSCLKTSWQYSEDRVLLNKGMLKSWEFRRHFYKDFFINLFLFSFFYAHLHLFANHIQIYSDSSQCQIFCLFLFIFISPLRGANHFSVSIHSDFQKFKCMCHYQYIPICFIWHGATGNCHVNGLWWHVNLWWLKLIFLPWQTACWRRWIRSI